MLILWFASSAAWSSRRSKARRPKASRPNSASVTNATARGLILRWCPRAAAFVSPAESGRAALHRRALDLLLLEAALVAHYRISTENTLRNRLTYKFSTDVAALRI